MMKNYKREINRLWNQWTEIHMGSSFYDVEAVIRGKDTLCDIESAELGDIREKSILHLQCHFGLDSISLSRRGARVTGVDLSEKSIDEAGKLAALCDQEIRFICSDIYEMEDSLTDTFDIVFTSYGVIGWLPDLNKWAEIISKYLKKGGFFYMAEFHPLYFMLDDNDHTKLKYPWDSRGEVLEFKNVSSYANPEKELQNTEYNWSHGIGTVLNAITSQNLNLVFFNEHYYSPYKLSGDMVESDPGKWRYKGIQDLIPYVFSLKATKF